MVRRGLPEVWHRGEPQHYTAGELAGHSCRKTAPAEDSPAHTRGQCMHWEGPQRHTEMNRSSGNGSALEQEEIGWLLVLVVRDESSA